MIGMSLRARWKRIDEAIRKHRSFLKNAKNCGSGAFLTHLMKYFQIQLILPCFAPKREFLIFQVITF